MILLTNSAEITLAAGQVLTFDTVALRFGCGEYHRENSSAVKMCFNGPYIASFSGNIGGTTAATPVQLAFAIGGEVLTDSVMISTPAAVGDLNNVSKTVGLVNRCGDYDRIAIINNGTEPVVVGAGSSFLVTRV